MQNLNRKGMSEVVVTVVLLLITLSSIALAGYSVLNLIKKQNLQTSPKYNCLDITTKFTPPIQIVKTCINQNNEIEALIRRSTEEITITTLSFKIGEEIWTCSDVCNNCEIPLPGSSKKYYLAPEKNTEGKTLEVYIEKCLIDKIKVLSCE